jgi:gluconolactonase
VYVADYSNHTIRKVTSAGVVTTLAGTAGSAGTADGTGGAARFDRPNGVALSPDESILYVAQSHAPKPVIMAYPLLGDGKIGEGKVFYDTKGLKGPGSPDGIKVNAQGVVFSTGPGGVLILSPEGKLLGRILCGRPTANVAFGPKQKSLFITSQDRLLRVTLR